MPQNVPVFEFLQTADANWNSLRTLPDWRQVWGSLCCNKDFEKALGEIQLDTYHHGSGSLYIEMLVQGELGRNKGAAAPPERLPRPRVPSARDQAYSPRQAWTSENLCCAVHAGQGSGPRHTPDLAGGLRWRRVKTRRRGEAQSEYKQILVPLWTGQ